MHLNQIPTSFIHAFTAASRTAQSESIKIVAEISALLYTAVSLVGTFF
jgi:hypothetical protein